MNNNNHITITKRDTWKKRKRTNLSREIRTTLFPLQNEGGAGKRKTEIFTKEIPISDINDFLNDYQDYCNNRECYSEDFIVVY